ncbi:MAG: integration host factor subunit alpha [SAR324 cluster bacterium]|nr:integration host factor subunit alpha [SAR324 cluster bacterium]MBF0351434.1 integration host factor subunit alpha [SAR324 cluster bacterium]
MVKVDIIREIQRQEGISFGDAEKIVNDILEMVKETLESGENVLISGFGKFELRDKTPRPGRDPKTKKSYEINERRVVTFYPSKVWRSEINGE